MWIEEKRTGRMRSCLKRIEELPALYLVPNNFTTDIYNAPVNFTRRASWNRQALPNKVRSFLGWLSWKRLSWNRQNPPKEALSCLHDSVATATMCFDSKRCIEGDSVHSAPDPDEKKMRYCKGCEDFVPMELFATMHDESSSCMKHFYSLHRLQEPMSINGTARTTQEESVEYERRRLTIDTADEDLWFASEWYAEDKNLPLSRYGAISQTPPARQTIRRTTSSPFSASTPRLMKRNVTWSVDAPARCKSF